MTIDKMFKQHFSIFRYKRRWASEVRRQQDISNNVVNNEKRCIQTGMNTSLH